MSRSSCRIPGVLVEVQDDGSILYNGQAQPPKGDTHAGVVAALIAERDELLERVDLLTELIHSVKERPF